MGKNPPPLLMMLGIIHALIVHSAWEKVARATLEKKDVPR